MAATKPPAGYVGMAEAEGITGYSSQTITLAAQRGELKALPRQGRKGDPWFFTVADLRAWRGLPAQVAS